MSASSFAKACCCHIGDCCPAEIEVTFVGILLCSDCREATVKGHTTRWSIVYDFEFSGSVVLPLVFESIGYCYYAAQLGHLRLIGPSLDTPPCFEYDEISRCTDYIVVMQVTIQKTSPSTLLIIDAGAVLTDATDCTGGYGPAQGTLVSLPDASEFSETGCALGESGNNILTCSDPCTVDAFLGWCGGSITVSAYP